MLSYPQKPVEGEDFVTNIAANREQIPTKVVVFARADGVALFLKMRRRDLYCGFLNLAA